MKSMENHEIIYSHVWLPFMERMESKVSNFYNPLSALFMKYRLQGHSLLMAGKLQLEMVGQEVKQASAQQATPLQFCAATPQSPHALARHSTAASPLAERKNHPQENLFCGHDFSARATVLHVPKSQASSQTKETLQFPISTFYFNNSLCRNSKCCDTQFGRGGISLIRTDVTPPPFKVRLRKGLPPLSASIGFKARSLKEADLLRNQPHLEEAEFK